MVKKNYYPLVDLVRFVAALIVLVYHLGYSTWQTRSNGYFLHDGLYSIPEMSWSWFGYVGVQVFFVISGFVIARSANGATFSGFAIGRIARLYPALWVCASITLLVCLIYGVYSPADLVRRYLASLVLFPVAPWMEGVYWTLILEVVFYALVGGLVLFGSSDRLASLAHFLAIYSGFGIVLVLVTGGSADGALGIIVDLVRGKRQILLWYGVFFSLGIYFYLWSVRGLGFFGGGLFVASLLMCVLQIWTGVLHSDASRLAISSGHELPFEPGVPILFFLLCISLIPVSFIFENWISGRMRAGSLYVLRILGLMTYPVYLVHFTLGVIVIRELVLRGVDPFAGFLISSALVLVVAFVVARYIEPPLQRVTRMALSKAFEVVGSAVSRR